MIRRLYTPFRVTCTVPVDQFAIGAWVYVDGVFPDNYELLLYLINGHKYPYNHFKIQINF